MFRNQNRQVKNTGKEKNAGINRSSLGLQNLLALSTTKLMGVATYVNSFYRRLHKFPTITDILSLTVSKTRLL